MVEIPVESLFCREGRGQARVTVGVTVYNYERYLTGCLASLAAQTFPEVDLVVVDDRSGDASPGLARAWLEAHAGRFNRVELLRHGYNAGVAAAHNTVVLAAHGEAVLMLDADNELLPRGLERLWSALEGSGADFAFGLVERFGEEQKVMHNVLWDPALLAQANYWDTMSLIRRSSLLAVGGFDDLDRLGWDDFGLWCKLALRGGWGVHVAQFVGRYRVHEQSSCGQQRQAQVQTYLAEMRRLYPGLFGAA